MRNNQPVTQREYVLDDEHFLITRTDLKGRITYANPDFVEVSGFSREELIGSAHNIVRHPDMPESIYKDFWDTLERGESWRGIIKNRRKDGDHYWVEANASPILEDGEVKGYASVRLKPRAEDVERADRAYALMREGRSTGYRIERGELKRAGLAGMIGRLNLSTIRARMTMMVLIGGLLLAGSSAIGLFSLQIAGERLQTMNSDGLQDVARLQQISQQATEAHQLLAGESRVMLLEEKDQHIASLEGIAESLESLWANYQGRRDGAADGPEGLGDQVAEYRTDGVGEAIALLQSDDRFDVFTNLPRHIKSMQAMGESLSAAVGTAIEGERRDAGMLVSDVRREQQGLVVTQAGMLGVGLIALSIIGFLTIRAVIRPLGEARTFTQQIASGNLGADSPASRKDELGELIAKLNMMRLSLGSIVGDVNRGVGIVTPAAHDIATGNEDISSRTEQQAASLQQTASSMEEITTTVKHNSDNARQANSLAAENAGRSQETKTLMHEVVETMDGITEGSRKMTGILDVIDSIAFQTNILALNASVEAARAGEQGRGFAVVAGEVRKLATRSGEAAKEIRSLIDDSARQIDGGADRVRRAEEALNATMEAATRVNDIMEEIQSASEEQSNGVSQINQSVAEIDQVTQQNAARIQSSAQAANELERQASLLNEAISAFRLRGSGMEEKPAVSRQRPKSESGSGAQTAAPTPKQQHADANDDWEAF